MSRAARYGVGSTKMDYQRLHGLMELLASPAELSASEREELVRALDLLYVMQLQAEPQRKGRRLAVSTWNEAATAVALTEQYGVTAKEAIAATLENGTERNFNRVARHYAKLVSGKETWEDMRGTPMFRAAEQRLAVSRNNAGK